MTLFYENDTVIAGRQETAVKEPDIPHDEQARLLTLKCLGILDTLPEERFDCLTRMAKRVFGVPIALVSLVDEDRQWFKSCVGLDVPETPRNISFCGHAILGDDMFVIPNAQEDERFTDNPLVAGELGIRFYAGCPLRALNGKNLGALCIMDRQPRNFDEEDRKALKDLALMAERELAAFQLATQDELTGISNRRGFMMLAEHGLHYCARHKIPASLAFLDLDKFKQINDTFGHEEGDRALVDFARLAKSSFRESDLCARLGGDEFTVLLFNTSAPLAEDVIRKFRASLEKHRHETSSKYEISFSYGIVEFDPEKPAAIERMLAEGDSRMYERKHAKK